MHGIDKIKQIILDTVEEFRDDLGLQGIDLIQSDVQLFGRSGILDSMGLVSLITDLEEKVEDEFGGSIVLADEKAMSLTRSPFRSVSTLARYVADRLREKAKSEST